MLIRQSMFIRFTVISILALSIIVACTERGTDDDVPATRALGTAQTETVATETSTAGATNPGSPGGTALVPDTSAGTTVIVMVNDGRIEVGTAAIPVGPAVLTVSNSGSEMHSLQVEGNGNSLTLQQPLAKEGRNVLNVEFKQGSYTLFCPMAGHR